MSEGILLPAATRGILLPDAARVARLEEALPQIRSCLEGETDAVAVQATLACLLWETMTQTNWCGFYRRVGESTLAVGPYQGSMGCLRIEFARGVCGAAARTQKRLLVPDVTTFDDHIACDDRTRSELVIPVVAAGRLHAVLDLDSPHIAGFCEGEAAILEVLVRELFDRSSLIW